MLVYLFLIFMIGGIVVVEKSLPIKISFKEKKYSFHYALFISIMLLALFSGMRGLSVGLDTPSYMRLYTWAEEASYTDYSYYWIEPGYAILMMVCSHELHLTFHQFLIFISIIEYLCIYKFIKRYSLDNFISILLVISFPLMGFLMTGIRNGLAICLVLSFVSLLDDKKKIKIVLFEACVVSVALLIHKSAFVFLILPVIAYHKNTKNTKLCYLIVSICLILGRSPIYAIINKYWKNVGETQNISLGISFLVYLLIYIICKILYEKNNHSEFDITELSSRALFWSLVLSIMTNGGADIMSRMVINLQAFIIILIPNAIRATNKKIQNKFILFLLIFLGALLHYLIFVLYLDPYGILPYQRY